MDRTKAIELLNKALRCVQTDPRNCGECKKCENYATKEDGIEAIRTALAALEKVPTALDHIHNVVAENERKRGYEQAKAEYDHKLTEIKSRIKDHYYLKGYEQGKKDAAPKWIPFTAETAPKEDGLYFVKIKAKSGNERVKTDGYSTAYGEWFIHDNDKVKKWMPIPKDEGE
jgi:hypothetical protein